MRIIRKLFYTTLTTFIILSIYTITNIKDNTLRTNFEIDKIANIKTNKVYLLNENNYLTEVDIFLDATKKEEQVSAIINYLKKTNNKIESNYKPYINENTKINNISIDNNILYLDLSKEIKDNNIDLVIRGLVRSLLEIKGIDKVDFKVDNNYVEGYDKLLTKDLAINKEYNFNNRKDINKVVIYYFSKDNNYIPVSKYTNDNREKIEIIIDELKNNNNNNLISYLNDNTELISYKEENNILFLDFNKYLTKEKNVIKYNLDEISKSVFNNYDVSTVMFTVEKKQLEMINKIQ